MESTMVKCNKKIIVTTEVDVDEIVDFNEIKSAVNYDLAFKIRDIMAVELSKRLIDTIDIKIK